MAMASINGMCPCQAFWNLARQAHWSLLCPTNSANHNSQLATVVEILYCPAILAAKLVILLQINHVFVTTRTSVRFYLVQLLIWSNILWYIINVFMLIFQCSPRAKTWNPLLPGHCFTTFYTINFIAAVINVISDIAMLLLPILWVWKLQMAWKRKIGISLVFASGVL